MNYGPFPDVEGIRFTELRKHRESVARDRHFPGAAEVVIFKNGGVDYAVALMPDGGLVARRNGLPIQKLPKGVRKHVLTVISRRVIHGVHDA